MEKIGTLIFSCFFAGKYILIFPPQTVIAEPDVDIKASLMGMFDASGDRLREIRK